MEQVICIRIEEFCSRNEEGKSNNMINEVKAKKINHR